MSGLFALYALSRGFGLVREMGTAYLFGTTVTADLLSASLVVSSVTATAVTQTVYAFSIRSLTGANEAEALASLARFATRAGVAITAIYAVIGPLVTAALVGGEGGLREIMLMGALLAPTAGVAALTGALTAYLTLTGRFALLTLSQALYSVGALGGIALVLMTSHALGPAPVAAGWSVGNIAAVLVMAHRTGILRRSVPAPRVATRLRAVWNTGAPVAAAYSLTGLQALTDRAIAARLGRGAVAALGYADRLFLVPIGFVLATVAPIVLGALAKRAGATTTLGSEAARHLRPLISVALPVACLLVGFSPLLVRFVFQYGAFQHASAVETTRAFDGLAIGIAATSVSLVLFRVMQVAAPLTTMTIIAAAGTILNAMISIALGAWLGLFGVALGTSLVALVIIVIQIQSLRASFGNEWAAATMRTTALPVVACVVLCGALIALSSQGHFNVVTRSLVGMALSVGFVAWLRGGQRRS